MPALAPVTTATLSVNNVGMMTLLQVVMVKTQNDLALALP
jgi:hypothetical protein